MSNLQEIQIKPEGLGHALDDNKLSVPPYQRSYAWKADHVKELFADYARAIRDGSEYFLGTIVIAKKGEGGRPEIVDGQQRLATTTILLAAIRDYLFENKDFDGAKIIEGQYLHSKELREREPIPHLKLNEFDGDFFMKTVLLSPDSACRKESPSRDSHRRIAQAANIARSHVRDIVKPYGENDRQEELNKWVDFIRDKAQVIWLTVLDYEDAYVIFETLNDRGLELSVADLMKNYLFWKAGRDRLSEVQAMWTTMTGILESVSGKEITTYYLHQLWSSFHGVTRKRDLFTKVRKQVKNKQAAVDLVKQLIDNAHLYAALRNSEHEFWNAYGTVARKALRDLQLLRVWQIRTLLLAVISHFTIAEAKKVFPLAVNWSVRFLVQGESAGNLESHYAKYALAVREGSITKAKELASAVAKTLADDQSFEAHFSGIKVSAEYLARYYLRCLNDSVGGITTPLPPQTDDESKVTLEHIYPRNPDPLLGPHYTRRGRVDIVQTGQLCLASGKCKLSSWKQIIRRKEDRIRGYSSAFDAGEMAQYEEDKWTGQLVDDYQGKLAKLAPKTWPIK